MCLLSHKFQRRNLKFVYFRISMQQLTSACLYFLPMKGGMRLLGVLVTLSHHDLVIGCH